jgi:hypothetical protein
MKPKLEHQIYHRSTGYAKVYPDHTRYFDFGQEYEYREAGYEQNQKKAKLSKSTYTNETSLEVSLRRTKTTITDITLSNEFDMFATFTFKDDRQDIEKCKSKMSIWLKNQKRIHGSFKYLIVPEFHKDRKSLHFHALLKGYKGHLTNSGHVINTRKAYNIKSYKLGFSTVVKIDNVEKVSSYVRKYITKDMPQFDGKKRYWCSSGLVRPYKVHDPLISPWDLTDQNIVYKHYRLTIYKLPSTLQILTNQGETTQWPTLLSQALTK